MSAAALVRELRARGVEVSRRGDRIVCRSPQGVLSNADLDRLRAHKAEVLALLAEPPIHALERAWRVAWERARASFHPAVSPSPETLRAAAKLELDLTDPTWRLVSPTRAEARELLAAVYAGQLTVRLREDGRVAMFRSGEVLRTGARVQS